MFTFAKNLTRSMNKECWLGWVAAAALLVLAAGVSPVMVAAQQPARWSPVQRIPEFEAGTWPPLMVADQNHTVHAFSSQWLGEGEEESVGAIVYNTWSLEQGWSTPVDIVLSPFKSDARLTGVFLDQMGVIHLTFFGGDNTEAYIYYTKALARDAGRATAWSAPFSVDVAANPQLAGIIGDDQGNLAIVYSGKQEGYGLYAVYSTDSGDTWSDPTATFLTYSDTMFPVVLNMVRGQSGVIHAVWDVRNSEGQGRQINYAQLNLANRQWSEPVILDEVTSGYGVLNPIIAEHDGELFVAYNGSFFRRSRDGGQTWTDPAKPFRHVGINGIMSLVEDSGDNLHFLWSQRITGSPDIHGTWHSVWHNGRWSEPEAVVSGPQVSDREGDKAFDPFEVRAVVSQGNMLLTTWRMDPGLKGNGVWYSYLPLDTPELPVVELPTALPPAPRPVALPPVAKATPTPSEPAATATPKPVVAKQTGGTTSASLVDNNPITPLLVGLVPVILLISMIILRSSLASHNHR